LDKLFFQEIGSWIKHQHPKLRWIHAKKLNFVMEDIREAKKTIDISIPNHHFLDRKWDEELNKRHKGVKLTVYASQVVENLKPDQILTTKTPFPFVLIDEHILWLGVPIEGANKVQPPYVAVRLDSGAIGKYLKAQLSVD
jgi:hypothetical protein